MLEFKNVSVELAGGHRSQPFSLVVNSGETACLCGPRAAGGNALLMAVMGLRPLATGYVTVDGELVCPGSADYFRHLMAYVPACFPDAAMKVGELCHAVLRGGGGGAPKAIPDALLAQWRGMGLDEHLYERSLDEVPPEAQQPIMLSMLALLKRPIVLIDNIQPTEAVFTFLRQLTADGTELVFTSEDRALPCNQLVTL